MENRCENTQNHFGRDGMVGTLLNLGIIYHPRFLAR